MYRKNKKGQSTVEYVLLVTAVIGVIIALVAGKNGAFQTQLGNTLNSSFSAMNTMGNRITGEPTGGTALGGQQTPGYTVTVD